MPVFDDTLTESTVIADVMSAPQRPFTNGFSLGFGGGLRVIHAGTLTESLVLDVTLSENFDKVLVEIVTTAEVLSSSATYSVQMSDTTFFSDNYSFSAITSVVFNELMTESLDLIDRISFSAIIIIQLSADFTETVALSDKASLSQLWTPATLTTTLATAPVTLTATSAWTPATPPPTTNWT